MASENTDLNNIRLCITNKFVNNDCFIVKINNSKGNECDNIYLSEEVHNILKKNGCEYPHDQFVFGSVQRDNDKIRMRFYKDRVEDYKGIEKYVLERFKLRSPYYKSKKSIEAYCFDYSLASAKRFEKDVEEFLRMFNKFFILAKKKLGEV